MQSTFILNSHCVLVNKSGRSCHSSCPSHNLLCVVFSCSCWGSISSSRCKARLQHVLVSLCCPCQFQNPKQTKNNYHSFSDFSYGKVSKTLVLVTSLNNTMWQKTTTTFQLQSRLKLFSLVWFLSLLYCWNLCSIWKSKLYFQNFRRNCGG